MILSSQSYFILSKLFYLPQVVLSSRCDSILSDLLYPPEDILSFPGHTIFKFPSYPPYGISSPATLCSLQLQIILIVSVYPPHVIVSFNQTLSSWTLSGYFILNNHLYPPILSLSSVLSSTPGPWDLSYQPKACPRCLTQLGPINYLICLILLSSKLRRDHVCWQLKSSNSTIMSNRANRSSLLVCCSYPMH